MNGQPTVSHPTNPNEQLIGKFHVEKLPNNVVGTHDEIGNVPSHPATAPATLTAVPTDESACASRFQMIRVDRNFGRGRWKVNDYEPPENTSTTINPPVNPMENEIIQSSNPSAYSSISAASTAGSSISAVPPNVQPMLSNDNNPTSSATLAAAAASAAAAAATAFQQQQQRLAMNNQPTVVPTANVPNPTSLLHAYQAAGLTNMNTPNQSYILANHPQFGYYPFFPSPYGPFPPQWAAALAAANPYLPPPPIPAPTQQAQATSQLPPGTGNLGDPIRYAEPVTELNNDNPLMPPNSYPNSTTDHLTNAQLAQAAFLYATHHAHSNYLSQTGPAANASPYATIPSYHAPLSTATIIPQMQALSVAQSIPSNPNEMLIQNPVQSYPVTSQPQIAPIMTSPKHEVTSLKNPVQQSTAVNMPKATLQGNATRPATVTTNGPTADTSKSIAGTNSTQITDLLSSPSIMNPQQAQSSLLSPITVQTNNATTTTTNTNPGLNKTSTASLNDIWAYTNSGSPLNLSQTAAQTAAASAVAAMGLLNTESGKSTIATEILKELTTPTKQNNTTDIDNKISAAMDLVKMHLLTAVREEVTELRQQIRTLNEKITSLEQENNFLRQHVSSEVSAQCTAFVAGLAAANDLNNPLNSLPTTTTTTSTIVPSLAPSSSQTSSQSVPIVPVSSLPSSLPTAVSLSTTSTTTQQQPQPSVLPSSMNLPPN